MTTRLLLALILSLTGCAAPIYNASPPVHRIEADKTLLAERLNYYPEEFKMSQHIILKINGKEYDFVGYLAMKRKIGFRALAFGEMGGKVFDLVSREGRLEILTKPEGMPDRPLLDGVMKDISHLYDAMVDNEAYPALKEDNAMSLIVRQKDGRFTEYIFSSDNERCVRSMEVSDGKIVRKAEYVDYRLFPGWDRPLPSRVILSNLHWRYEMKIEMLKIDAGPINEKLLFPPDQER